METNQERKEIINKLINTCIAKYTDFIEEHSETIEDEVMQSFYDLFDLELTYGTKAEKLIKICEKEKFVDLDNINEVNYYEVCINAVNTFLNELESKNKESLLKELTKNKLNKKDVEGIRKYYEFGLNSKENLDKFDKYEEEQSNLTGKLYKDVIEQYRNILISVDDEYQKEQNLKDIELAVNIIKENYLGNFKEDKDKTIITAYTQIIHGRILEKGEEYTKAFNTLYFYLYPLIRSYEILTYFSEKGTHITEQLENYAEELFNLTKNTSLKAEPVEQSQIKNMVYSDNVIFALTNDVKNTLLRSTGAKTKIKELSKKTIYKTEIENRILIQEVLNEVRTNKNYGINADKIMTIAISLFGAQNSLTKKPNLNSANKDIYIDFIEYSELIGKNFRIAYTDDCEKMREEEEKIKEGKKDFKKKLEDELATLKASDFTIEDKNDEPLHFGLIQSYQVSPSQNHIYIELTDKLAKICLNSKDTKKTQIPKCLFKISGRRPNAWKVGVYLATIFNMTSNIQNHRNNIVKVTSLLRQTDLPNLEELKNIKKMHDWYKRILTPLENALDQLLNEDEGGIGFLKQWTYCHEKGRELTKTEWNNWKNKTITYNEWLNWYVTFTPNDSAISSHTKELLLNANSKEKHIIDNE